MSENLTTPVTRECTVMFYLASDNPLAISVVSQLKAIKAAGYHPDANVIVQFDPYTKETPTHVFDVNLINKIKNPGVAKIGFDAEDSFVRNLIEDKLWGEEQARNKEKIRDEIKRFMPEYKAPLPPNGTVTPAETNGTGGGNAGAGAGTMAATGTATAPDPNAVHEEMGPRQGLRSFLDFCAREYPARHYLLFILGHGVVVGNDVFLYDENATEHSLKLDGLREELETFTKAVQAKNAKFDLVGFHSCSVSSLEVAYELKDTANYMIASQGTAFVGSWPYRQILVRLFKDLQTLKEARENNPGQELDLKETLIKIFFYCLHNSTDFLLAGYPFDLCMCDLSKMPKLETGFKALSEALKEGVDVDPLARSLILLAHWKAQSFFKEMYTDLADFCFCLENLIAEFSNLDPPVDVTPAVQKIRVACVSMLKLLEKEPRENSSNLAPPLPSVPMPPPEPKGSVIVCSEFAGPEYQYARGLSIYFPWTMPSEDRAILKEYRGYKLSELKPSWLDFLEMYFERTKRLSSREEIESRGKISASQALLEDKFSLVYGQAKSAVVGEALDQEGRSKTDPKDATGGDCGCPTIKNYPRDTRSRFVRVKEAAPAKDFSVGDAFLPATSA